VKWTQKTEWTDAPTHQRSPLNSRDIKKGHQHHVASPGISARTALSNMI